MVLKSEIEKAVEEQEEFLQNKNSGISRIALSDIRLSAKYILIITGIRRCGKSTLMHQLSRKEMTKNAFFNFEDSRIHGFELTDFSKLTEVFGKKIKYYFFDEIQNVAGWEVFIRQLHDQQKIICITGSNASLLSKELGTKLTGRNIQIELFPFSFSEYCSFKKTGLNEKSFTNYLQEGGFPDYLKTKQIEYLQQLFKDIIYRDIIVRHGIRNAKLFMDIALFLIANSAKEYSLNRIKNTFGIGSANSVSDYVQWLEDAYVLFSVPRFNWSLKSIAVNPKKVYTIDTGFAQANSLSFSEDNGRLFENCIFLELRRKYKEIFYFKEKGECDFIVKEGKKIIMVLQVCSEVNTDNTKREMDGLVEALDFFKLKSGIIITLNQKDTMIKDGKQIQLVPAHIFIKQLNA
jgi:predicted AAA+ superfamily ATPase